MGAAISTIIGTLGLVVVGVMSSIAASKSDNCKDAKKIETWTAVGSFIAAIISLFIAIFMF